MGYAGQQLTVDLETQEVRAPGHVLVPFALGEFERQCILEGLDEVGLTLRREEEIAAYEAARSAPVDTLALAAG
jgi:3-isopropylmalate dehydratase small subunit